MPKGDITSVGIPIHPVFAEPKERAACCAKHRLAGDRPIVLQLAGGFGVGPIEQIYRAILDVEVPLQVVVIAGRNEAARTQLEAVPVPERHRTKVMGFTSEIDELMAAADLVVSKPGGLTTSETLARGAAMVIVNPIPGQESRNSDFLLENDAAIKVNNIPILAYKVTAAPRAGASGPAEGERPAPGPAARCLRRGGAGADVCQTVISPRPSGERGRG